MASFARLLGGLLRHVHAGERHLAWFSPIVASAPDTIIVTSAAFGHNEPMPDRCAALPRGISVSPPLAFRGAPRGTRELVLIAQDPDAPLLRPVLHALVTGIPPDCVELAEGVITAPKAVPFKPGRVHGGRLGYTGPKPPPGHGRHRYIFQILASDAKLSFRKQPADLQAVLEALRGHVTARGQVIGTYEVP